MKDFWTYRSSGPVNFSDLPKDIFSGSEEEWNSLSPGYQREILRTFKKREES